MTSDIKHNLDALTISLNVAITQGWRFTPQLVQQLRDIVQQGDTFPFVFCSGGYIALHPDHMFRLDVTVDNFAVCSGGSTDQWHAVWAEEAAA